MYIMTPSYNCLVAMMMGLLLIPSAPAGTSLLKVDKNHSSIVFHVPILDGLSKVHGKFTDFDINIKYDEADLAKSSVEATIKVASIDTGIPDRDKDLRSPQFFDADKYPSITFSSNHLEKRGDQLVALGTLTMHGVPQEISLPIVITGKFKNSVGFAAKTTLNRRSYGMNWKHSAVSNFVGDDIEVEIELLTSIPIPKGE